MNEKNIASKVDAIWGVVLWACIVAMASLAAFAIREHQKSEAERAERIHQAGMAVGAALCGKDRQ
jgi:cell division protein FtsI/penicillin-binding protein 2